MIGRILLLLAVGIFIGVWIGDHYLNGPKEIPQETKATNIENLNIESIENKSLAVKAAESFDHFKQQVIAKIKG